MLMDINEMHSGRLTLLVVQIKGCSHYRDLVSVYAADHMTAVQVCFHRQTHSPFLGVSFKCGAAITKINKGEWMSKPRNGWCRHVSNAEPWMQATFCDMFRLCTEL